MCICEKREGDKVRVNSGGCAKFACLFQKHLLQNWPMSEVLGWLGVSGIC